MAKSVETLATEEVDDNESVLAEGDSVAETLATEEVGVM